MMKMRCILITILACYFFIPLSAYAGKTDTLNVQFDYNVSELNEFTTHILDSLLIKFPNLNTVKIMGYTDFVGGDAYNKILSTKRAQSVSMYLIKKGLAPNEIVFCKGKGKGKGKITPNNKVPCYGAAPLGYAPDRRVTIIYSTTAKDLNKLHKNETIVMENVLFLAGSHHYTPASAKTIEDLIATLKKYPKIKLQIEGHICCETEQQQKYRTHGGDSATTFVDGYDYDSQTLELSVNRAKEVYQKIIEGGIDSSRLSYKGFGATKKLINPENSEDDKNKNRRVELRILAN